MWSLPKRHIIAEYAYVQFERHLCRVNLTELPEAKPPSFEVVANFQKLGLPLGMGAFVLDSRLYMTGGEIVRKDVKLTYPLCQDYLDVSDGNGLNTTVFVFDPSNLDKPFSANHNIPPMCAPKPKAKVANIDGKIYVLGCRPIFFKGKIQYPEFECFDLATKSWEELPQPPWYKDSSRAPFLHYFDVMDRKIQVRTRSTYFLYDVDLRQWQSAESFLRYIGFGSAILPFHGDYSIVECKGELVISHTVKGLVAYLFEGTTLKSEQKLHELNAMFTGLDCPFGFIRELGGGKFCYIYSSFDGKYPWLVSVSILQVKMQAHEVGGDNFLSVQLLHRHEYDCESIISDFPRVENVFVMCDHSKKRSPECMEQDGTSKSEVFTLDMGNSPSSKYEIQAGRERSTPR